MSDPEDFRALVHEMLPMQERLEQGHFRKKYQPVAHIAHGWLRRCVRGAEAIVALGDAGFEGETQPLARSVLEHVVALRWLVADGDGITAPLRTTHGRETSKLHEALKKSARKPVDEDTFAEILASSEHDDHGRDNFQQFAHRAAHHGRPEDLTVYHALVMESHATWQSAVMYWDPETKRTLARSRTDFDPFEFSAVYLYRALMAYGAIFAAPPWRRDLALIEARLVALDPDLDGALN